MKLPLLLRCVRCGCDETVRMWTKDPHQSDFALCTCRGNLPWNASEVQSLIEQAEERIINEHGPSDSDLPTFDEALAASLPRHGEVQWPA